jgi:hypothetical protein
VTVVHTGGTLTQVELNPCVFVSHPDDGNPGVKEVVNDFESGLGLTPLVLGMVNQVSADALQVEIPISIKVINTNVDV